MGQTTLWYLIAYDIPGTQTLAARLSDSARLWSPAAVFAVSLQAGANGS